MEAKEAVTNCMKGTVILCISLIRLSVGSLFIDSPTLHLIVAKPHCVSSYVDYYVLGIHCTLSCIVCVWCWTDSWGVGLHLYTTV